LAVFPSIFQTTCLPCPGKQFLTLRFKIQLSIFLNLFEKEEDWLPRGGQENEMIIYLIILHQWKRLLSMKPAKKD
jgi:hypothetical protein